MNTLLPNVEEILAHMGDSKITHMTIVREPLSKALTTALNVMSLGEFKQTLKEQPFDRYFHVFMVVETSVGRYVLQKNSVITMNKFEDFPKYSDPIDVELKENEITMNGMLEVTRKEMGEDLFFGYDAASNNCQTFMDCVLKSSLMSTPATEAFIVQDSEALFEGNPRFQLMVNDITNIGALAATEFRLLQEEIKSKAEEVELRVKQEADEIKRKAKEVKSKAEDKLKCKAESIAGKKCVQYFSCIPGCRSVFVKA
jgi:hypothetical protein